jgi:hypothetical protein
MKSTFCCKVLEENIIEGGRKGFSVIPFKHENNTYSNDLYTFFLQYREIDFVDNNDCTMAQRAISFCPWCGTELAQLVLDNEQVFEFYSKKNNEMII